MFRRRRGLQTGIAKPPRDILRRALVRSRAGVAPFHIIPRQRLRGVPPRERIGIVNLFVARMLLGQRTRSQDEEHGDFVHGDCEYSNHCRIGTQPKPIIPFGNRASPFSASGFPPVASFLTIFDT